MKTFFQRCIAATLLVALAMPATSDAQERNKASERQRGEQQERASKPAIGGWPSCHSGLVILEDGATALCQRRNGRVCTMSDGGGPYVTLSNCR